MAHQNQPHLTTSTTSTISTTSATATNLATSCVVDAAAPHSKSPLTRRSSRHQQNRLLSSSLSSNLSSTTTTSSQNHHHQQQIDSQRIACFSMTQQPQRFRHKIFFLLLTAWTLHATVAFVTSTTRTTTTSTSSSIASTISSSSTVLKQHHHEGKVDHDYLDPSTLHLKQQQQQQQQNKQQNSALSTPRQARIVTPLSTLAAFWISFWNNDGSATNNNHVAWAAATTSSASLVSSDAMVQRYFPGALSSQQTVQRILSMTSRRNYTPANTLLASSICSDELNHFAKEMTTIGVSSSSRRRRLTKQGTGSTTGTSASIISMLEENYAHGSFHLGGLGGLPFVGVSGVEAMLAHVPLLSSATNIQTMTRNGNVLIFFGPHVGISSSSSSSSSSKDVPQVGMIHRHDMDHDTTACGAAIGAYKRIVNQIQQQQQQKDSTNPLDFQQEYIVQQLTSKLSTMIQEQQQQLSRASNTDTDDEDLMNQNIVRLTKTMYDLIYTMLQQELQQAKNLKSVQEVTLVGGIMIQTTTKEDDDNIIPSSSGRNKSDGDSKIESTWLERDYFQPLMVQVWKNHGDYGIGGGSSEMSNEKSLPIVLDLYEETF